MPAPAGTKRVKGVQIHRPFVYGSVAKPLDPSNRPPGISPEHTHQWTVFVRGVNGEDISYWLKKVQFKLHETYANAARMVEAPAAFEVTESGWGEFEVQLKLYFAAEANEKAQTLWHALKLHPYAGDDVEAQRARRDAVVSQNFEEVVFSEPVEAFYDVLTSGPPPPPPPARGKGAKGSKQAALLRKQGERSAEIPFANSEGNPFSQKEEGMELDRLKEATKTVEGMVKEERAKLAEKEKEMEGLRREGAGQQGK